MPQIVAITGASSGIGALTARALAKAGHIVFAGHRSIVEESSSVESTNTHAQENKIDIRPIELDVVKEDSVQAGVARVIQECGRLDILIHNAGHMAFGPCEAFTPEQLAMEYNINCIGTQRVNRAALPHMRKAGKGLIAWVGSSSTRGGTPPYLGPYFAAKAGMDALAECYAGELALWGIETSIIVPGAYTSGTNHFAHAAQPGDNNVVREYEDGPTKGLGARIMDGQVKVIRKDANPENVAKAIVGVVGMEYGTRPFRVHVDTEGDGAHVVNPVADRVREQALKEMGLEACLVLEKDEV
ncbi:MAG: hypothetical protein Q9219_005230 [cf. Caloplaca sp. 3 TL-2023]